MKRPNLFLSSLFILLANFCFGQNASLSNLSTNFASYPYLCDSLQIDISPDSATTSSTADFNLFFTGSNLLNQSYTLEIEWANGNTTTHTGTATATNTPIIWSPSLNFATLDTGHTSINLTLIENSSNDSLFFTCNYVGNACQKMSFTSFWDCDGDGIMDSTAYLNSVFLISGTDTTFASGINNINNDTTFVYFPNLLAGQYTVGVNQFATGGWWGSTLQPIQSMTPSSITLPSTAPVHVDIIVDCAYQSCFTAVAFCDDNGNGIYDSLTENPIPNMPLQSTQTDSSGYAQVFLGDGFNPIINAFISKPTNWIQSNGFASPSNTYFYSIDSTYLDSNCNSLNTFNIPLYCNLTNADSVCFDGITFNDLNGDGIMDSGEPILPNVQLNLTIDSITMTLMSNSNGYYSYSGLQFGGATSVFIEGRPIWLANNNYANNFAGTILSYNCDSANTFNLAFIDPNFTSIDSIVTEYQNNYSVCDSLTLSLSAISIDSTVNEDINLYFTGSSLLNENYSLQVNWGDNNTTVHTGTATAAGQAIVWSPALSHVYAVDSNYTVTFDLTKMSNQHTQQGTIQNVNSSICLDFTLDIQNQVDCDGDGAADDYINIQPTVFGYPIPVSALYLYSGTDTVFAQSYANGLVSWPDSITITNYTLGILQSYLDDFDLEFDSTSMPNGISMPYSGPVQSVVNVYSCIVDTLCVNGYVFCDDNGNGIMDANESIIPGVPFYLNGYINSIGSSVYDVDTTDAAGFYNFPLTVYDSAYFSLNLDPAWLTANGYIAQNSSFDMDFPDNNDSLLDCSVDFNIPIICNATASDSICVNGQIFCDINGDGILDSNETVIPNAPVRINDANGTFLGFTFSDSLGNYSYHNYHPNTDTVNVTITSWWLNQNGYNPISPITVSTLDCSINTDIGIDCNIPLPCDGTWINMFGVGSYFQNWTNTMALTFGNSDYLFPGSVYTISIVMPNGSSLDSTSFSIPNYTVNGDTLSWTQTISSFDSLLIDFNIASGIADSTLHNYQVFISGPNLDCDSTNNSMTYTAVVGNSFDPNNKLVNLPEFINPDIQEELYYVVNFQNTGTAPAQDVFIEDQLSPYLDWSTLEVLSKSHNMFYTVDQSGMLVFTFPQIWLPDSTTNEPLSKGYVAFKIKENANIQLNETIENTAYIYFDFNPPIITNTTRNTNVETGLGLSDYGQQIDLTVFPNPSSGLFNIQSSSTIQSVIVYDLMGKMVYNGNQADSFVTIDLTDLSKGMYQMRVATDKGIATKKLILK